MRRRMFSLSEFMKALLTFATALRSILRAAPDIVMIGEMRDLETVEITIRAALTGHLVSSGSRSDRTSRQEVCPEWR